MVKKEMSVTTKISAKGILQCIDDEGLHIEDCKSGTVDVLSIDALKLFVGKEINFSIGETAKAEKDIEEDEE